VIALVRGGGANADLSWFNDYAIGRAVCLCPVPVIVGIGHDRDETLPDRLARNRSTPTAVAEALAKQVQAAWSARASRAASVLERVKARLAAAQAALRLHRAKLARLPLRLATTQLPLREQRLRASAARLLERARHGIELRSRDLAARDPVRMLAQGYARLATRDGQAVRRAADLAVGQEVLLRMADGTASARIQDIEVRKTEETPA
jgi:exodeoxyribonuclease VII large subunit